MTKKLKQMAKWLGIGGAILATIGIGCGPPELRDGTPIPDAGIESRKLPVILNLRGEEMGITRLGVDRMDLSEGDGFFIRFSLATAGVRVSSEIVDLELRDLHERFWYQGKLYVRVIADLTVPVKGCATVVGWVYDPPSNRGDAGCCTPFARLQTQYVMCWKEDDKRIMFYDVNVIPLK